MKTHGACFKCKRTWKPLDNDIGSNTLVQTYMALSCPNIPDEINPLGIVGQSICPMANARKPRKAMA